MTKALIGSPRLVSSVWHGYGVSNSISTSTSTSSKRIKILCFRFLSTTTTTTTSSPSFPIVDDAVVSAHTSNTAASIPPPTNDIFSDNHNNNSIVLTQESPNERERPLQYHGRIVATPIPDFVAIRDLRRTAMNTAATTVSSNSSSISTSSNSWLDTVLLPKHSKYSRATEKEIDPISIYGTAEIPLEQQQAQWGPIYYQPHQSHHFDWCTNTMNQISTTDRKSVV